MYSLRLRFLGGVSLVAALCGATVWLSGLGEPTLMAETKDNAATHTKGSEYKPVAMIELFTSEGCSSCPSADDNLQRIAKTTAAMERKVIPLSFHVDYWNRLGWKDPFSQAAFSKRQREYATAMKNESVYTPQMIINGTSEFVGSDRRLSDRTIREALEDPAKHSVMLTASDVVDQSRLRFRYQIVGPLLKTEDISNYVINIAVATDSESVSVTRGENGGRELSHVWVVKSFNVIRLTSRDGTFEIAGTTVKQKHSRLIVYLQSQSTHEITGASTLDL